MNISEELKTCPGFVYQIGNEYYFLGKWICKPCTDTDITDCFVMFEVCHIAGEAQNAALYFQKLRAYSDFALDIPYNPQKISKDTQLLFERLSTDHLAKLEAQVRRFREVYPDYTG